MTQTSSRKCAPARSPAEERLWMIERIRALEEALRWATPLAGRALAEVAATRAQAGHTGLGTKQSSLYDSEVDALASARALLGDQP